MRLSSLCDTALHGGGLSLSGWSETLPRHPALMRQRPCLLVGEPIGYRDRLDASPPCSVHAASLQAVVIRHGNASAERVPWAYGRLIGTLFQGAHACYITHY